MKRAVFVFALLCASGVAHSMSWADLWSRPDQQTIAQREQAYTEIQGQQFAAAAAHLKPFADPVSQYNRGNALAHTGDLQAALSAYDSVLHDGAADMGLKRDAQHNRDLVEQQSKSQNQPDKSGDKGDKDQKNNKSSGDGKSGKGDETPSSDKAQEKKEQGDKAQDGNEPGDKSHEKKDRSSKSAAAQNAGKSQPPETAQREPAQSAPDSNSPDAQGRTIPADERPGDTSKTPPSEQAQSLDQWLRWIPDDPGGLLRRKFMIEHMLNQHGSQQ
jgi:Ca-activated chloride channel homolog